MLEAICSKIMGGSASSRHHQDSGGNDDTPPSPIQKHHRCWSFRSTSAEKPKRPKKLPKKLRLNTQPRRREDTFVWEEIPTPVYDHRETIQSEVSNSPPPPPTQERLMQIISCFPYPTPRASTSPKLVHNASSASQNEPKTEQHKTSEERRAFCDAFGKLVKNSVETMAITALPMDVWLKERLKKWVQLSGHEGSIVPATKHTLYKKQCANCGEGRAYKNISRDSALNGMTPKYYDELEKNDEHFIEIEDLLQQFTDPTKTAIMDIKIGTRTFLESEVSNAKKRGDLYEKMIAIDADEPTEEERNAQAITKLRYMQFRERESSTAQLGFRIEAAKRLEGSLEKNFKKVRTIEDVATTFIDFFGDQRNRVRQQLANRLREIRKAIENSTFFQTHEVVGSSILIVFDAEKVGCWMIDFAKSSPVPSGKQLTHRQPWVPGNNEDGYLIGIDNLLNVLENLPPYGQHPDDQLLVTEEVMARLQKKAT